MPVWSDCSNSDADKTGLPEHFVRPILLVICWAIKEQANNKNAAADFSVAAFQLRS